MLYGRDERERMPLQHQKQEQGRACGSPCRVGVDVIGLRL
jgi:hypothetical protein